jgi:hypothetical protein
MPAAVLLAQRSVLWCFVLAAILGPAGAMKAADADRWPPGSGTVRSENDSFQQELDALAVDVADRLCCYPVDFHPCKHAEIEAYDEVLRLVAVWSDRRFHAPLAECIHYDGLMWSKARALRGQRNAELLDVGEARRDCIVVFGGTGCFPGKEVPLGRLLDQKLPEPGLFLPEPELLMVRQGLFGNWLVEHPDESMTVPRAAVLLFATSLSVRLQSWCWLAERGIAGPDASVRETWSQLDEQQRSNIAFRCHAQLLGAERLRRLFEDLLPKSEPEVEALLLRKAAGLGSQVAVDRARAILGQEWYQVCQGANDVDQLTEAALHVVAQAGTPQDIAFLEQLARDPRLRCAAIAQMLTTDCPSAVTLARKLLADDNCTHKACSHLIFNIVRICAMASPSLNSREEYLEYLADIIDKQATGNRGDFNWAAEAFARLADRDLEYQPWPQHGFDEREAQEVRAKYLAWYRESYLKRRN